jgi:hypothetical protein
MAEVIARQPLFPDVIREEILRAFEALRWGQTDGILQPRMRRRRALPYDAATAELHALMWMRY